MIGCLTINSPGVRNSATPDESILRDCWDGPVLWDCPMARFSSLKAGGPAKAVVHPRSSEELGQLIKGLNRKGVPWRVIGRGSNILVTEKGYNGVVVVFGQDFSKISFSSVGEGIFEVIVEAGCSLNLLLGFCRENSLTGLEFCSGIPGSVGGAIVTNAGIPGKDISQVIRAVTLMDHYGDCHDLPREKLSFSYRGWNLKEEMIVVTGKFRLEKGDPAEIDKACRKYLQNRKAKQPSSVASAGSFFKNPPGAAAAGALIEQAGLKGTEVGGARVSEKHANFIINTGNATAEDILALMRIVQERVFTVSGVHLEPEVHIFGQDNQA